jgi:hypothetical protein
MYTASASGGAGRAFMLKSRHWLKKIALRLISHLKFSIAPRRNNTIFFHEARSLPCPNKGGQTDCRRRKDERKTFRKHFFEDVTLIFFFMLTNVICICYQCSRECSDVVRLCHQLLRSRRRYWYRSTLSRLIFERNMFPFIVQKEDTQRTRVNMEALESTSIAFPNIEIA